MVFEDKLRLQGQLSLHWVQTWKIKLSIKSLLAHSLTYKTIKNNKDLQFAWNHR